MTASSQPSHLFCAECNYNLHGLPIDGNCPECGTPIGRSLRPRLLESAGLFWRVRFGIGLWMLIAGMFVGVVAATADQQFDLGICFVASGIGPSRAAFAWDILPHINAVGSEVTLFGITLLLNGVACWLIAVRGPRTFASERGWLPILLRGFSLVGGMAGMAACEFALLAPDALRDFTAGGPFNSHGVLVIALVGVDLGIVVTLFALLARRATEARGPRVKWGCIVAAATYALGIVALLVSNAGLLLAENLMWVWIAPSLFAISSLAGTWVAWDFQFKIRDANRRDRPLRAVGGEKAIAPPVRS